MWQTIKNVILSPTTWKTVCEHTHINLNKMHLQTKIPLLGFVHREFSWSVLTGEEVQMKVLSKTNSFFSSSAQKNNHTMSFCATFHTFNHTSQFSHKQENITCQKLCECCVLTLHQSHRFSMCHLQIWGGFLALGLDGQYFVHAKKLIRQVNLEPYHTYLSTLLSEWQMRSVDIQPTPYINKCNCQQ